MTLQKVHFLFPPSEKGKIIERIYGCSYAFFVQQNVFVLSTATLLKRSGFKVEVTDSLIDGVNDIRDVLFEEDDAYCFYSNFLSEKIDLKAAKAITKYRAGVPIIFMGSDPSWNPDKYIIDPNFYVVRGEPEYSLLALLCNLEKVEEVQGISWMNKNGEIIHNPMRQIIENLDVLPHPDRTLLKNQFKYTNPKFKKHPCTTIITSRGCPYRCSYCVPNSLSFARELEYKRFLGSKPPVKLRSTEDVVCEFEEIASQGYAAVQIVDDFFTVDKRRAIDICESIKDLGLELCCLSRADYLTDEKVVKALARAGVTHIDIGVESFCQKVLDAVKKELKVESVYKAYSLLRKYEIEPELNILLGSTPIETKETIEQTIKEVRRLDPEILHSQICTPFPGTEFYYQAKNNRWIITDDYVPINPMEESIISYPHLSKEDLEIYAHRLLREHYLRPIYLWKQLYKTRTFSQLKKKIMTMYRIFKMTS